MDAIVEQLKKFRDFCREEGFYSIWTLLLVGIGLWFLVNKLGFSVRVMELLSLAWLAIWLIKFLYIPRRKNGKLTILLAIETDGEKDQQKFRSDCVDRFISTLNESGFVDRCKFIVPERHQCRWFRSESGWRTLLFKFVKPHFAITGTVKRRGDKMFIEPKGLVVHSKTSDNAQADLSRDFSLVLPKEISIVVNEETVFRGFQMTADIFSHAALFIIGSAALLSRDYKLALEIHGVCRNLVATAQTLPTAQYIARKVKDCIFVENFLLARSAYYLNQINDSVPYMTVALEMQPAFYEVLLLSGAILFKRGEYKQALEIIKRAKKHSGSRTEWMFSICFLYLWFENYDEAVKICKKIQKLNKDPIINIVDDVIRFNTILRTEGRANTQSYFWTGFLEYKVKGNIPTAFSDLTQFKNQSTEAMLPLITLADNWLGEMKEVMSIE